MVVDAGDGATMHIDKKEVEKRTKGLSPMPQDITKPLSKRDVRDLVEFLATLKAPATQPATPTTQRRRRRTARGGDVHHARRGRNPTAEV